VVGYSDLTRTVYSNIVSNRIQLSFSKHNFLKLAVNESSMQLYHRIVESHVIDVNDHVP